MTHTHTQKNPYNSRENSSRNFRGGFFENVRNVFYKNRYKIVPWVTYDDRVTPLRSLPDGATKRQKVHHHHQRTDGHRSGKRTGPLTQRAVAAVMGSGGDGDGNINKIVKKITTSVHSVAASTSVAVVDMVYGLHPDSTTGGCVVQRSFEDSLRAEGITSIRVHVASTPSSAERVFHRLLGIDGQGESGIVRSCCGKAIPRVLIVDGIALMFMRDRLRALKEETPARLLVGFVHFPFSEPFYRKETWLRAALPEHMVVGPGAGKLLREEETRLFGHLDKIVAVGTPCRSLLTDRHGVSESALILLEPTFATLPPPLTPMSISVPKEAYLSGCAGSDAIAALPGDRSLEPEFHDRDRRRYSAPFSASCDGNDELLHKPRSSLRFVTVGTLCTRKGQLELVEALGAACSAHPRELSGSVLTLIGGDGSDPAYASAVRNAAKNINNKNKKPYPGDPSIEVHVLGSLPRDSTLERLSESDAFLLNSSFESWGVAPVEAALQGIPVVTTRVGALEQSLPSSATLWVGRERCATYFGKDDEDKPLASAADWERALVCFARDRRRLRREARHAVSGLRERFGRKAASSRVSAVRGLLSAMAAKADLFDDIIEESLPAAWHQQQQNHKLQRRQQKAVTEVTTSAELERSGIQAHPLTPTDGGVDESAVTNPPHIIRRDSPANDKERGEEGERERIRKAMVMHALLSVICAACFTVSGHFGVANGTLTSLFATQLLLIGSLAPPPTPANVVTVVRSFIPATVVWLRAGSDFGQVTMGDVSLFGVIFVLLDVLDGKLARASKAGPTRVGAALDVESDSTAMLFLSLVASRKAWSGGVIAGVLRYLFVLATAARELPPSPIGPAGRWLAKVAALVSVIALAFSVGGEGTNAITNNTSAAEWLVDRGVSYPTLLCFTGVAILCASFSVDFYQIWVILPREEAKKAKKAGGKHAQISGKVLK